MALLFFSAGGGEHDVTLLKRGDQRRMIFKHREASVGSGERDRSHLAFEKNVFCRNNL